MPDTQQDFVRVVAAAALAGFAAGALVTYSFGPQQRRKPRRVPTKEYTHIDIPDREPLKGGSDPTKFEIVTIEHLNNFFEGAGLKNQMNSVGGVGEYNQFIGLDQAIQVDLIVKEKSIPRQLGYVRAGPREILHFDPSKVTAAIVTCGGLCPGLNNVIRGITKTLIFQYQCKKVLGVKGGFDGFVRDDYMILDRQAIKGIQNKGGTILGTSRGGFDLEGIMRFVEKHSVDQLYVIGGDGTHRGAYKVFEEAQRRGLALAVGGIPKTIDNDIDLIDRTFGFQTSVEAAQQAIRAAKTEAQSNMPNGIGLVKLMGRHAGFLASHATLSSGDVDLCLIPEEPIDLDGCVSHLEAIIAAKGHAVVVVAEGAGEEICKDFTGGAVDKSGNRALPPVGDVLSKHFKDHFKTKGMEITLKYIDPSYTVRACAANAADGLYCMMLAQNVVHGCMAGYTGFTVGLVNNRMVLLPIPMLVANSPRVLNPNGRTWERVLTETGQMKSKVKSKQGRADVAILK